MIKQYAEGIKIADGLSEQGTPFLFAIDFHRQHFIIQQADDLQQDLVIDFPGFSNAEAGRQNPDNHEILFRIDQEKPEDYYKQFNPVHRLLKNGEIDVINFTRNTPIYTNLSLQEIFDIASAKYKILFQDEWVCFSPETFVRTEGERISSFPMKGTIDAAIPEAKDLLLNSTKEIEEHKKTNHLIIDDLEKVATGVSVTAFRTVSTIRTNRKTLLTTSSTISGTLKPLFQNRMGSLIHALLPAGSVAGHPRGKALKAIEDYEGYERGFYCGICGYFDGENMDTCVLIRFIQQENGRLFFRSGGGITALSDARKEYEEVKNKIYVPLH